MRRGGRPGGARTLPVLRSSTASIWSCIYIYIYIYIICSVTRGQTWGREHAPGLAFEHRLELVLQPLRIRAEVERHLRK